MVNNQTISAVLFVFNEEKYLPAMLDSILGQTQQTDAIIVVDDQSTDRTKQILHEYASRDERVKYYWNPDKGKVNAYRLGLTKVTTDLFFVCGGDDVLFPDYVAHMYFEMLLKYDIQYCYADLIETDANLNPKAHREKKLVYHTRELLQQNFTNGLIFGYAKIIPHLLDLPRELLFEDWYTSVKLSVIFGGNYVSDRPLVYYRRHGSNATALNGSRKRYRHSIKRNLIFYQALADQAIVKGPDMDVVQAKIKYYRLLLEYNIKDCLMVLRNPNLDSKDKLRALIHPAWVKLKYKAD